MFRSSVGVCGQLPPLMNCYPLLMFWWLDRWYRLIAGAGWGTSNTINWLWKLWGSGFVCMYPDRNGGANYYVCGWFTVLLFRRTYFFLVSIYVRVFRVEIRGGSLFDFLSLNGRA